MSHAPDPDRTPDGPSYEGRLLPRPAEEVVDQGAGFDIGTLVTRRRMLGIAGIGVGALALAACSGTGSGSGTSSAGAATAPGEIPQETNGPYPADGTTDLNILERSGITRRDITSSLDGGATVEGVPLELTVSVVDMANDDAPFEGAAVYVWHCDAQGRYSMYSQGVEDQTWLRGLQAGDAAGTVTFRTIVPGCYAGRWPHIHFEVYPDAASATNVDNAIATSQLAFPADMLADVYALGAYAGSTENLAGVGTTVQDDGLFDEGDLGLQVVTVSGDVDAGYVGSLTVNIDTTTEPGSGQMGGAGGPVPGGEGGDPPNGRPPADGPPTPS